MEPFQPQGSPAEMHPESHKEKNTGMAIVAYLIFFLPLLTDAKHDPFVKYHVHQGFVLFLAWVAASVLIYLPIIGLLSFVLHIGLLVLLVLGIMNAAQGKEAPLPLIGQFASHFHF